MTLEYTFADNAFAELTGQNVKFWLGTGLPDYEGSLLGFSVKFPEYFNQLIAKKIIKAI
jgi:hypothetical protein